MVDVTVSDIIQAIYPRWTWFFMRKKNTCERKFSNWIFKNYLIENDIGSVTGHTGATLAKQLWGSADELKRTVKFIVGFFTEVRGTCRKQFCLFGYPELWILRYPAHRYHAVPSPGFEPTTLWLRVRRPNHSPFGHDAPSLASMSDVKTAESRMQRRRTGHTRCHDWMVLGIQNSRQGRQKVKKFCRFHQMTCIQFVQQHQSAFNGRDRLKPETWLKYQVSLTLQRLKVFWKKLKKWYSSPKGGRISRGF
jgi:hypothetical protein